MQPNKNDILAHLNFLFSEPAEYKDGLIEIAYTPTDSGAVNKAEYFTPDEIEKAADFAERINAQEGVNVYVGAALRNPDTAPFGRSNAADYYAASAIWCDLDDPGAAETAKEKYSRLPPSLIIVTGRAPNLRAQAWWKLMLHETDAAAHKDNLAHICAALNGDRAVVDPARVMRLGGTIAWPKKEGRVPELTEIKRPEKPTVMVQSGRFKDYFPGVTAPLLTTGAVAGAVGPIMDGKPRNLITGKLKYNDLLERTRTPGQWHVNMRDAVASMVSSKWTDEQIRLACGPYCNNGPMDNDLTALIYTGRNKWAVPDPANDKESIDPVTGEIIQDGKKSDLILTDWIASERYIGEPPEIKWLIEGTLQRGIPALFAAMGGLGKSFTVLDMCIEIASPPRIAPKRVLGGTVVEHGTCVFITAEDSVASVHRRIHSMCAPEQLERTKRNLIVVPMPDAGGPQCLVKEGNDGIEMTDFFYNIKSQLIALPDLKLVIFDPLQAFVSADITSRPEHAQYMWTALAQIASETGATILCTHHMRKEGQKTINDLSDAREAIRGTTGLVDGCRLVYAMWQASTEAGQAIATFTGTEYEPSNFVQGGVVKANDQEIRQIVSFVRQENGVLKDVGHIDITGGSHSGMTAEQCRTALREIRMAWEQENPFGKAATSSRPLAPWLQKTFDITKKQAAMQVDNWLNPAGGDAPLCEVRSYTGAGRRQKFGIYVNKIP